jgi:hypothetical protein
VRAVATGINDPAGTGSLSLTYSACASGGDLAIVAANKNNGSGVVKSAGRWTLSRNGEQWLDILLYR